jgi:hypothetical protein
MLQTIQNVDFELPADHDGHTSAVVGLCEITDHLERVL